jgi:hypothetical protein
MKDRELVTIEEAAYRLKYSVAYFRNSWPRLLSGVKPIKVGAGRKILFRWHEIERLLEEDKL